MIDGATSHVVRVTFIELWASSCECGPAYDSRSSEISRDISMAMASGAWHGPSTMFWFQLHFLSYPPEFMSASQVTTLLCLEL